MNTQEFIEKLSRVPLSDQQYKAAGISGDEIYSIRQRHIISPKEHTSSSDPHDPIVTLVEDYDTTNVEIGMITFNTEIQKMDDYLVFGKDEIDHLAIDTRTGEIVVLDEVSMRLMQYCAKDSASFLDAIIIMAKFLKKRGVDDNLYEDEAANLAVAKTCTTLAGGEKYSDYYVGMTGF